MPFTIEGNWVPNVSKVSQKPVKIRLIKRGQSILTVILNLNMSSSELVALASAIKKKLGCGGAVKDNEIEVQGDKVIQVKNILEEIGIKSFINY